MREIKFRAWDKEMEMIIYPKKYYAPQYKDGHIAEYYNPEENEFHIVYDEDDKFVLMQFTGLLDKNGKEIYEGDIVMANTPYCTKDPKEIVWDDKRAGFFMKADFVAYDPKNLHKLSGFKMEVIGNIYENPELLTPPTEQ